MLLPNVLKKPGVTSFAPAVLTRYSHGSGDVRHRIGIESQILDAVSLAPMAYDTWDAHCVCNSSDIPYLDKCPSK